MSLKLKALGLGLLAALSVSAVAVMNAGANGEGHFVTTGNTHTHITATEGTLHKIHLVSHGLEGEIGCDESLITTTTTAETSADLSGTATYNKCYTTNGGTPGEVTVTMNGCTYTFTVAKGTVNTTEQTAHLICPHEGLKRVEVHHPNCTITIPPQTVNTGITYTTVLENNIHAITAHVNVQFTTEYHGGLCVFLGTNHTGTLKGTATVRAFNTVGGQVPITAT
jgi:hypothetical protein